MLGETQLYLRSSLAIHTNSQLITSLVKHKLFRLVIISGVGH
jgi:hypothetical protein